MIDDVLNNEMELLRKHERAGRPMGDFSFIEAHETLLDRALKLQKPGLKVYDQ